MRDEPASLDRVGPSARMVFNLPLWELLCVSEGTLRYDGKHPEKTITTLFVVMSLPSQMLSMS